MKTWPIEFTPEVAATICARSAAGEGVIQVCKDLGLDPYMATAWLQEQHLGAVVGAKKAQIRVRQEKEKSERAEKEVMAEPVAKDDEPS